MLSSHSSSEAVLTISSPSVMRVSSTYIGRGTLYLMATMLGMARAMRAHSAGDIR